MKLIQRIGYYLGGFSMGLIILAFFLNGKKTSCSYGPESRVLKNITTKKMLFNEVSQRCIHEHAFDTATIRTSIKKGNINFSKSSPRNKPCGIYLVNAQINEYDVLLTIENCDSIANITNLKLK
ncbi:hypothetical protein [Cognatitamlana onchidii]|uniref:hypothetical protein n=1 Tax=Cognatitamlana onchidii TaxID=2562860 RepID=UPI0010A68650|nr:hypothetical protein [Algibacter onchidii]